MTPRLVGALPGDVEGSDRASAFFDAIEKAALGSTALREDVLDAYANASDWINNLHDSQMAELGVRVAETYDRKLATRLRRCLDMAYRLSPTSTPAGRELGRKHRKNLWMDVRVWIAIIVAIQAIIVAVIVAGGAVLQAAVQGGLPLLAR